MGKGDKKSAASSSKHAELLAAQSGGNTTPVGFGGYVVN